MAMDMIGIFGKEDYANPIFPELLCKIGGSGFQSVERAVLILGIVIGVVGNLAVAFVCATGKDQNNQSNGRCKWMALQLVIASLVYLIFALFHAISECIGLWSLGLTMCKIQKMGESAGIYAVACFLMIINIDSFFTKLGTHYRPPKIVLCSGKLHKCFIALQIWVICLLVSIPQYLYAHVDVCKQCTVIYPISKDEICFALNLNETTCTSLHETLPLTDINTMPDYSVIWDASLSDVSLDSPESYDYESFLSNQITTCKSEEAQSYYTSLYLKFGFHFLLPVLVMLLPLVASFVANDQQQSNRRWGYTTTAFNLLFVICWLPAYVIEISRINGIEGGSKLCEGLIHYIQFSTVFHHVIIPFLYMTMTANFLHQLSTAIASVVYCLAERATTSSNSISLQHQTSQKQAAAESKCSDTDQQTLIEELTMEA